MYQTYTPNASKKFTNKRTAISRIHSTQENGDTQIPQLVSNSDDSSDGEAVSKVSDAEEIAEVQWKILGPSKFLFPSSKEDISANTYLPFSGMFICWTGWSNIQVELCKSRGAILHIPSNFLYLMS